MPLAFHPSLKKFLGPKAPIDCAKHIAQLNAESKLLQEYLDAPGVLNSKSLLRLLWLGYHFDVLACDSYGRDDSSELAKFLNFAVAFRALHIKLDGTFSEMTPDEAGGRPIAFWDSMKAIGKTMMSHWDEAQICGIFFLQMAEKDQKLRPPEERRLRHGSNDAFLIHLFSQSFGLKTSFISPQPLIPEYQTLLDCWQTTDENIFKESMQAAADFHISRSKDDTSTKRYEFAQVFDRIFPAELLSIQALRRRDGLPAFDTGHALIDTPWSVIKDLPEVEPHPLAVAVEARLKKDYPLFR
jgi:hypothetical protein